MKDCKLEVQHSHFIEYIVAKVLISAFVLRRNQYLGKGAVVRLDVFRMWILFTFYKLPLIETTLLHVALGKHCLSHGMCLYQVMMTLHLLNDVTYDAESTQNQKLRHNCLFEE